MKAMNGFTDMQIVELKRQLEKEDARGVLALSG
jgi:hypothetical protein